MTDQIHPMLFDEQTAPVPELPQPRPLAAGVARVLMPNRAQLELRASDLDSLLPEGHRAHRHRPGDPLRLVAVRHPRRGG